MAQSKLHNTTGGLCATNETQLSTVLNQRTNPKRRYLKTGKHEHVEHEHEHAELCGLLRDTLFPINVGI